MPECPPSMKTVAAKLATLYNEPFGGKQSGRYRIAGKLLREISGRKKLYESDIEELRRHVFELGYVLIDMDSFFVLLSANTFVNYRRANDDCLDHKRSIQ